MAKKFPWKYSLLDFKRNRQIQLPDWPMKPVKAKPRPSGTLVDREKLWKKLDLLKKKQERGPPIVYKSLGLRLHKTPPRSLKLPFDKKKTKETTNKKTEQKAQTV